jgi:hypothetical protein
MQTINKILIIMTSFKSKLMVVISSIMSFFLPIQGLILLCILAVLIDTLYALYKVKKLKEKVTSDKLFNIIPKSIGYILFILFSFMIDSFIFDNKLPVVDLTNGCSKIVTFICVLIELRSIDETSVKLGNKPFDEQISLFIKFIRKHKKNLNSIKDEN